MGQLILDHPSSRVAVVTRQTGRKSSSWPTPTEALPTVIAPQSVVQPQPTPTTAPVAVPLENLNVRAGPGITYEKIGLLVAGSEAPIIGQNEEGSWWQIDFPDGPAGVGWISAEFAEARNLQALTSSTATPSLAPLTPTRPLTAGLTVTTPPSPGDRATAPRY